MKQSMNDCVTSITVEFEVSSMGDMDGVNVEQTVRNFERAQVETLEREFPNAVGNITVTGTHGTTGMPRIITYEAEPYDEERYVDDSEIRERIAEATQRTWDNQSFEWVDA